MKSALNRDITIMTIFILLIIMMMVFVGYRVYGYKKQRAIEEMAANAQAYVSSEIVDLLQQLKKIVSTRSGQMTPELQALQSQIQQLMENMVCHTDSEASIREYLSLAKQDIAVMQVKLNKLREGELVILTDDVQPKTDIENAFDALK